MAMTSSRPYLIRALYDWIIDNGLTPYLLVDAARDGVQAPTDFADEGGRLVLNISPRAVRGLDLGQEDICFSARCGGTPWDVHLPTAAIIAIYARENGQGMMFSDDDQPQPPDDGSTEDDRPAGAARRPNLRVVKSGPLPRTGAVRRRSASPGIRTS